MPGLRILLADDEPHITHLVSRKLAGAGFEAVVTQDGEEALRVALEHPPDLVVTDLQMPRMSGFELAAELRRHATTAEIPVILLTARGYFLSQDELGQTNIREVLSKPFTARGLLERIIELTGAGAGEARSAA